MSGRARLLVRRMVRSGVVLGAALVAGACGDDGGTRPGGDDLSAPAAIRDLDVVSVTETGVTIHWTSPGDDGAVGTADRYDLRYGTDPIDEVSFAAATAATNVPAPRFAGTVETFSFADLARGTWYFAIKSGDEVQNWSQLSNVLAVSIGDSLAPAAVTDLFAVIVGESTAELSWTAPGDDGVEGQAERYEVRYATDALTETTWEAATVIPGPPPPDSAGTAQSLTVSDLPQNELLRFGIRTMDNGGNWSALSNVAVASTEPDATPPDPIVDLMLNLDGGRSATITWTAPGDDGGDGLALAYDVRFATEPITPKSFADAMQAEDEPAPQRPGQKETFIVHGLETASTFYIALVTRDDAGNTSDLSNVLRVDTGSSWRLTFSPPEGDAYAPDWSPDGSAILCTASYEGAARVYRISLDDGKVVRLTEGPVWDTQPQWSPDGERISFTSTRGGGSLELYVADATPGATARKVASLGTRHIGRSAWSPDGQELAFDETFVAVTERIPIRVVSVDGGETRILIEAEAEGANLDPEWSPDGSRIAMFSFRKSFDLYTVPLDGGSWTRLTTSPSYDTSNHEPAWSPDGTRIAYATVRNGRRDLRLVSATGGTPVVLTDDAAEDWTPTWSPDGTAIAFSTDRSGNFEIWVMPVEPR